MKIKKLFLWQMRYIMMPGVVAYYGVICAVVLLQTIFMRGEFPKVSATPVIMGTVISLIGLTVGLFTETFKAAMCNGISRKTMIVTQFISNIVVAASMAITNQLLMWLVGLIYKIESPNVIGTMTQPFSTNIELPVAFAIYLLCGMVGYFVASLNARLNKTGKFVVYISTGVVVIVVVPMTIGYLNACNQVWWENFKNMMDKFGQFMRSSSYNLTGVLLGLTVIVSFFSVLLVRRITIKTV